MTPTLGAIVQKPGDIYKGMNLRLVHAAYDNGMNLSRYLEELDPSSKYPAGSDERRMSAFERQLEVAGIVTNSDPEGSYEADCFEVFGKDEATRILGAEFVARQWRKVAYMSGAQKRAVIFGSDDYAPGSMMRPIAQAANELVETMVPQIPLNDLLANTTTIQGTDYRAMYIDWPDTANYHYSRVGEGADIPAVYLTSGERSIKLHKYGVKIVATYEQLRRVPLDIVALLVQRIAIQSDVDKIPKIMNIMINGDGNANTAATSYNLTTLDTGATANNPTLRSYLAYRMKFKNPYRLTTLLAQEDALLNLAMVPVSATGQGGAVLGANGIGQINIGGQAGGSLAGSVDGYVVDDAPTGVVVGFDKNLAIERIVEVGSTIQEMQRWMQNQTEELFLTEVEGYRVFDGRATILFNEAA
jgi:hypothetical protein